MVFFSFRFAFFHSFSRARLFSCWISTFFPSSACSVVDLSSSSSYFILEKKRFFFSVVFGVARATKQKEIIQVMWKFVIFAFVCASRRDFFFIFSFMRVVGGNVTIARYTSVFGTLLIVVFLQWTIRFCLRVLNLPSLQHSIGFGIFFSSSLATFLPAVNELLNSGKKFLTLR